MSALAYVAWPPAVSLAWLILGFLWVSAVLGTINVATRIFAPKELCFEIRDHLIYMTDLKRSGHGYTTHVFKADDVETICYDSDGISYVQTSDGKTQLGGEIMILWDEVEAAVAREFPHISITRQ